jgi:AcrR family transcriptional regulator
MTEKQKVIDKAIELGKRVGLVNLSRQEVSDAAGIKDGSFPSIMEMTFSELLNTIKPECPLYIESVGITKKRLDQAVRKDLILAMVLDLCEEHHYSNVTRPMISDRLGISERLVTHHFETMKKFQRELIRYAIQTRRLVVIGQAVAAKNPYVKEIDSDLRAAAIASLA